MPDQNRRRLLKSVAGLTVVGTLAGCSGGSDETETDGGDDTITDTDTEMGGMDSETDTEAATDTETATETDTATDTEASGEGAVRVAHMSPNAPNVDVYLNGNAVLEGVQYTNVSDYLTVPAGEHTVAITPEGEGVDGAVFEGPITVAADTDYTVAAVGEVGSDTDTAFEPLVMEDDNTDPGGNDSRVRIVHASPDAPAVDVTALGGDVVLADGAEFRDSLYVSVEANGYTIQVRPDTENNDGEVVYDEDISLNGGTVYTVFAAGYLSPDDDPSDESFDLVPVQDASY